jgi:L-histidine N-alpha-methyltransferase
MRTEISAKFTPERIRGELGDAGFAVVALWTDPAGDFALTLAR